jgi:Flp pilus assembly protein TadB
MEKKIFALLIALALVSPAKCGHDGGAAVAGALGGLAIGTMIGHATAVPDKRNKADRLEEKIEQEQRARDQEKVRQLENKLEKEELKRKIERQRIQSEQREKEYKNMLTLIVLGIIAAILLALFGVGIAVLIHRKKGS